MENCAWTKRPTIHEVESVLREHEYRRVTTIWENYSTFSEEHKCILGIVPRHSKDLSSRNIHLVNAFDGKKGSGPTIAEFWRRQSVADQQAMARSITPTTRAEYQRVVCASPFALTFADDFVAMLHEAGDVDLFLVKVWDTIRNNAAKPGVAASYIEVLTLLRARGFLLFPIAFWRIINVTKWAPIKSELYGESIPAFLNTLQGYVAGRRKGMATFGNLVTCFVATTSLNSVADLSPEIIDEMEQTGLGSFLTSEVLSLNNRDVRWAASIFRHAWNLAYPERRIKEIRSALPKKKPDEMMRSTGLFLWVKTMRPEMTPWVEPLASWIHSKGVEHARAGISDLNLVMDFFLTLKSPPLSPDRVLRHEHIHDVTFRNTKTLMHHLERGKLQAKRRTRVISSLRTFFNYYGDWLRGKGEHRLADSFKNPVTDQDKFEGHANAGSSHRAAIPGWVLRELEAVLTENDYAFPKTRKSDWFPAYDYIDGTTKNAWWPGPSIALLTLITTPIRSHQSRWLDSGEFDEYIYDHATRRAIKNPSRFAVPNRSQGCIRLMSDSLRMETWIGLFVNTNKTSVYGAMSPGYEIPYVKPSLVEHLTYVRDWNRRFLPPMHEMVTVRRSDSRNREEHYEQVPEDVLPRVAPLFRDPFARNQDIALSYARLSRLFIEVLKETEGRVKKKYDLDITLTKQAENGNLTWRFDLHTLRVSGISAMIDNGVPIEIVSQFVAGHNSLLMTLWYYKNSPEKLRDAIAKNQALAEQEGDFIGGSGFASSVDDFAQFLLSKGQDGRTSGTDPAFVALKEHTGLWAINSDGICPGTSCATGGELGDDSRTYGAVPGGRRCGLCRYWLTGPAFIMGQMAEANNLVYQIRKKGIELAETRDTLIDLEDAGLKSKARRVRDRIEYLERELQLDITEWTVRYGYAMSSSELLDEYDRAKKTKVQPGKLPTHLLTSSSPDELRLTLQQSHEFILIDHVTQMCDFMPGFENREARNEKHLMLAKVLAENGMQQFMLKLDKETADYAADLMSSLILQYVKAQDLDSVLSGKMKLAQIPALQNGISRLEAMATTMQLQRGPIYLDQGK